MGGDEPLGFESSAFREMKTNVREGVCGVCGTAVVHPEAPSQGWHDGHLYERKLVANQTKFTELVLVRVRCMAHKESADPRYYARDGHIREDRDPGELYSY